jgi:DNA-binding SARP family transcriptional activator
MYTLQLLGSASLDGPDGPVTGRAGMRQRVAMLALLAVEHPRPLSRDKLVAYLWPESGTDDARHLLRESLYILRSALGDDTVLGSGDDLRLNSDRLTCDLWEFEAALAGDDHEAAVSLYRGAFLSGFHLSDADEFERWVDGERSRLARRYCQALEQLAERHMGGGDAVRAVEWWSRLAREDPYNSRIALRYMQALEAAGDRAAALRHASAHSELLRSDLDAAPEQEVVALAERLRLESRAASGRTSPPAQPASAVSIPLDGDEPQHLDAALTGRPGPPTRRQWVAPTVLVLAMVVGLGVLGGTLSRARAPALAPRRVAAAPFENRTGRPDLDDLGALAADWMIQGVMETPLVDLSAADLEAVYAWGNPNSGRRMDPRTLARQDSAGIVIRGSYYLSGDSVLFQAGILDVASGRVLRSLDPVGAPVERAMDALEVLRERIAMGLSPLINREIWVEPIDPDLVPAPRLSAYREFVAGLRQVEPKVAIEHYRRAASLDTNFAAPLIQLATIGAGDDQCATADSIAVVLEPRRDRLSTWNRLTFDELRAGCRGDMAEALRLLRQRSEAYPRSVLAQGLYATVGLQSSNRPRAARETLQATREMLLRTDPERALEWTAWYWWRVAATYHATGDYHSELSLTDRWRDSTTEEWRGVRGRALAALGRERELLALLGSSAEVSVDSVAGHQLEIATELVAHGHPRTAMTIAESLLARFALKPDTGRSRVSNIAWANQLLGQNAQERDALEEIAGRKADTIARLEAEARIAVLLADTARAEKIDSILTEQSDRPLRNPWVRSGLILARAHIAAGFGRRERAVALLRDASARGLIHWGPSHAFHADLLLLPLRGYPPFDALLKPDN